ncbi:hypothetical protein [Ruegeria sp. Ofav3-42]|uniref:hypothetical protein n=1 Tax=Ruegeria sp. Ofav3-42 TaxID=2917759 RepID=UPI001EF5EE96|nr:hypothetical protein [Ruegeria sp. Ofav3-42]MCG7519749.1 hypothetical protein [Ruegeria sp. Ofav3-42]
MVPKLFKTRCIAALAVALWLWGNPIHAQNLVQDFENLFERCRVSVETSSVFDSRGLQRQEVPQRHERDWGMSSAQEAWVSPGSEWYVLLTEWTSRDGTKRHLCNIFLNEEEYILGSVEQALLLRHFLMKQVELISAGTHENEVQLSPISPLINAAFLLSGKNPKGCIVINSFAFSPDGMFFSAGSGEQAVKPCEAE